MDIKTLFSKFSYLPLFEKKDQDSPALDLIQNLAKKRFSKSYTSDLIYEFQANTLMYETGPTLYRCIKLEMLIKEIFSRIRNVESGGTKFLEPVKRNIQSIKETFLESDPKILLNSLAKNNPFLLKTLEKNLQLKELKKSFEGSEADLILLCKTYNLTMNAAKIAATLSKNSFDLDRIQSPIEPNSEIENFLSFCKITGLCDPSTSLQTLARSNSNLFETALFYFIQSKKDCPEDLSPSSLEEIGISSPEQLKEHVIESYLEKRISPSVKEYILNQVFSLLTSEEAHAFLSENQPQNIKEMVQAIYQNNVALLKKDIRFFAFSRDQFLENIAQFHYHSQNTKPVFIWPDLLGRFFGNDYREICRELVNNKDSLQSTEEGKLLIEEASYAIEQKASYKRFKEIHKAFLKLVKENYIFKEEVDCISSISQKIGPQKNRESFS